MSTKQFISAEEHLAKLDVTVQQANNFIVENIDNPELLFETARQNKVTNKMLSEITNFPTDAVQQYFSDTGFPSVKLDRTSLLVNYEIDTLETLVNFNTNTGILSTTSLSEAVRPMLNDPLDYDYTFDPIKPCYTNDNVYDKEELGVGHLSNVPATNESVESLFYGTLINMFKALDESELNQINAFPNNGSADEFQELLFDALNESPTPSIWTEEQLAGLVTNEATDIIDKYWEQGNVLVGVLDLSFLGLATASS